MRARAQNSLIAGIALSVASFIAGPAAAQPGQIGSYTRPRTNNYPTVSPYLNLTRPGQTAVNYFGIVRPQVQTNRAIEMIEQGAFADPRFGNAANLGVAPDGTAIPGMNRYYADQAAGLQTGHPATFFHYSHYYQFPNAQRSGGSNTNSGFGRPTAQPLPFYTGTNNGILMPVDPGGANPLGGTFGTIRPQAPGQTITP